MSRGFVKEEDQEEAPIIPPRAALPETTPNLVTEVGMLQLEEEKKILEKELRYVSGESEKEKRYQTNLLNGKLKLLQERLNTARVVKLSEQPQEEVRFGATVTFTIEQGPQAGTTRTFQLVGVDEADIKQMKIAFVAPIARALIGKKEGEKAEFQLGTATQELRIKQIKYSKSE